MSKDWHSGHFCCWNCDESLTGQRYVLRDEHPYCIKCYESVFANTCEECSTLIGIDSKVTWLSIFLRLNKTNLIVVLHRIWVTKTSIGMKRVSCAICVAYRSLTNNLDRKLIRSTAVTATIHNLHRDVMVVVKFSVLVSSIYFFLKKSRSGFEINAINIQLG